jgi:hypothetical protein
MNTIREGDLFVIVRWPCCCRYIGHVNKVVSIEPPNDCEYHCGACGAKHDPLVSIHGDGFGYVPVAWVKKIPPLSEPSHTERREEIEA